MNHLARGRRHLPNLAPPMDPSNVPIAVVGLGCRFPSASSPASFWRLLLGAAVGVPVGVWGLKTLPSGWTTTGLGPFLIFVGLYNLTQPSLIRLSGKHWPYLFGFVAGTLGGAYNIASPPILVYGITRRWSPQEFRFTLQSFFLPLSAIILISHASAGLWTTRVFQLFALALPIMMLAFWLGNRFNRMITAQHFERMVYGGLIVLGIALLV